MPWFCVTLSFAPKILVVLKLLNILQSRNLSLPLIRPGNRNQQENVLFILTDC